MSSVNGSIRLSVIIPAYNEERRLPDYLLQVREYLGSTFEDGSVEILVVDDGSSDATAAVVTAQSDDSGMVRLLKLSRNRGKGYAVKAGMLEARGEIRLFTDADGSTPITELEKLMEALERRENQVEIVVASRALFDDKRVVESRVHRKCIGNIFNLIVRCLAVRGIRDTQCGFKLFSRRAAEELFGRQRVSGFGFDVELLFLAQKLGFHALEVPVNWTDMPGSKVNVLADSARMFRDLMLTRINWLLGLYNAKRTSRDI